MGASSITLERVLDTLTAKGIPNPRENASGYGDQMALDLATQVMADIACERFNWKWNRADATPFLTNSWQQDYPQLAQPNGVIGWGEDCDAIDVLNTSLPKPLQNLSWRRGLSRTSSLNGWWPANICWMYNRDLFIGAWPGAGVTYFPLTVSPQPQNPLMSMTDVNGNILIVTTFGTTATVLNLALVTEQALGELAGVCATQYTYAVMRTPLTIGTAVVLNGVARTVLASTANSITVDNGGTPPFCYVQTDPLPAVGTIVVASLPPEAPALQAASVEGATVMDGTVVWTCVSPTSQGFRIDRLPPAQGPTLLIKPYYQIDPVIFTGYSQTLSPMPDSFSRFFYRGLESELLIASPNPGDMKRGQMAKGEWEIALREAMKQGDREANIYRLLPAEAVVEPRGQGWRPYTADDPI